MKKRKVSSAKSAQKRWRDYFDALWRVCVWARDGWKCRLCGATSGLQAHHIIPRRYATFRHVMANGLTLCARCHLMATHEGGKFYGRMIAREEAFASHMEKLVAMGEGEIGIPDAAELEIHYSVFVDEGRVPLWAQKQVEKLREKLNDSRMCEKSTAGRNS